MSCANLEKQRAYNKKHHEKYREADNTRCREYYAAHQEEMRAEKRDYYASHLEEAASRSKAYAIAHKEELQAYKKTYRALNPEQEKARSRAHYRANREQYALRAKAYRATHRKETKNLELRRLYGITINDFESLWANQGQVCAICKTKPNKRSPFVDHDHSTGRVRGIVCYKCNTALGMIGDNLETAWAIIDYLATSIKVT